MNTYDKEAFMAGYRAALTLRGITPSMKVESYIRQLHMRNYELIWNNSHSFTIAWTVDNQGGQGVILYPDLYPVKLTGRIVYNPGSHFVYGPGIQIGECNINGTMPSVISAGANRYWWSNWWGDAEQTIDNVTKSLDSAFFGDVFSDPGTILSMTVEW